MWTELAFVHKRLEGSISSLLKEHVVIKRVNNKIINLLFEIQ